VPPAYKRERGTDFRDTVIKLPIDNSGSFGGRPITVAATSGDIFARTLERCGVKVEILGFTTLRRRSSRTFHARKERWRRSGMGHEGHSPPRRLRVRCRLEEETFAGTRSNGRDAPCARS
jgi:cobalamin biosynthesis protein CobT